jgi:adenylate kinase
MKHAERSTEVGRHGEPRRVVLIGPPGAGKGTQAQAIASRLAVPHISTGDIFRRHLREGTALGNEAKTYMDNGDLVPDELTVAMVSDRLEDDDAVHGFLLDGFPRNPDQAKHLDEILQRNGTSVDVVVELRVPEDEVVRRLAGRRTCGECGQVSHVEFNPTRVGGLCDACGGPLYQRDDDREDSIRRRMELHGQQTAPLVAGYEEQEVLVRVDAIGSVDVVGSKVLTALVG